MVKRTEIEYAKLQDKSSAKKKSTHSHTARDQMAENLHVAKHLCETSRVVGTERARGMAIRKRTNNTRRFVKYSTF